MEGLADHFLRTIISKTGGYDLVVTEFIRVVDLLLPEHVFLKKAPELTRSGLTSLNTPVRVQLLGSNIEAMAQNAIRAIELGSHGVDLNFGCPSKTVNKSNGGAILLDEPEALYQIVKAVRDAVPEDQITSAKMRLGFNDDSKMFECADALASAGANEITIHARTKVQGYKPPAHWHLVSAIQKNISIPIFINGEIWTPKDAQIALTESGCSNIMIGRGAIRHPWLAKHIKSGQHQSETWEAMLKLIREFWYSIICAMPSQYCAGRLKQWLNFIREAYPQADVLYQEIRPITQVEDITRILEMDK